MCAHFFKVPISSDILLECWTTGDVFDEVQQTNEESDFPLNNIETGSIIMPNDGYMSSGAMIVTSCGTLIPNPDTFYNGKIQIPRAISCSLNNPIEHYQNIIDNHPNVMDSIVLSFRHPYVEDRVVLPPNLNPGERLVYSFTQKDWQIVGPDRQVYSISHLQPAGEDA